MDILYNNKLINQIVDKLFKHRRVHYSEYHLQDFIKQLGIKHEIAEVMNQNYQKLYTSIFRKQEFSQVCIIYMHGYGSNRLECVNFLKYLPGRYALCCFDFSGCGKSEGDLITYGMKEKQDIHFIINFLKGKGFKKFMLWGRSMGATSALLYTIKYQPKDITLLLLDSPFYSFSSIAFDIANKNINAPQFVISFALQMAKKNCSKFHHNPFEIQLKNINQITIPSIFVYCEEDNVINSHNTYLICSKYKTKYEKLIINENHNTLRTQATYKKILYFIEKYNKKQRLSLIQSFPHQKNKQYMQFSHIYTPNAQKFLKKQDSNNTVIQYHPKKGIQRVNQLMNMQKKKKTNQNTTQLMQNNLLKENHSSSQPKRQHLSLINFRSSIQKPKKIQVVKREKKKIKENETSFSVLFQNSNEQNLSKNINKKINLIQSTKLNHLKILKIIKSQ